MGLISEIEHKYRFGSIDRSWWVLMKISRLAVNCIQMCYRHYFTTIGTYSWLPESRKSGLKIHRKWNRNNWILIVQVTYLVPYLFETILQSSTHCLHYTEWSILTYQIILPIPARTTNKNMNFTSSLTFPSFCKLR